ncbi:MAG TPA: hypothetical protein VF814_05445 [Casimicrobiaceae bacterium]
MNLVQSDNFIFATFYVYGPNNQPIWYTGELTADGIGNYTGGLYVTTGTYLGIVPYDPAQFGITQAGTATFTPTAADTGVLSYNIGSVTVTKNIQRFTLTGIALGAAYVGGQSGAYTSCADSSANGSYLDKYTLGVKDRKSNDTARHREQRSTSRLAQTVGKLRWSGVAARPRSPQVRMFGERQRVRVACPATAGMRLPGGALGWRSTLGVTK